MRPMFGSTSQDSGRQERFVGRWKPPHKAPPTKSPTVPPKSLSRKAYKGRRQQDQPRSGLDISALLSTRASSNQNRISASNAIPEFKQVLENAEDVEVVRDAVMQLGDIVSELIKDSMGDSAYDRAVECIRVMREECVEMEEPAVFNDFARGLKTKLLAGDLGGHRNEMWYKLRVNKLGLIGKSLSDVSDVDEEEAASVSCLSYFASRCGSLLIIKLQFLLAK